MDTDQISSLLREACRSDAIERTNKCLSFKAIYEFAFEPSMPTREERKHFVACSHCQSEVSRLRRNHGRGMSPAGASAPAAIVETTLAADKGRINV